MSKQFTIKRKIGDMVITSNGFATLDLPRDYDYQAIGLRIEASIAISAAVVTAIRAESPCQLVPRVEVIADGKNNLFSAPFWATCLGNVDRPLLQNGARATTPQSAVGIATYATEAIGVIDFQHFQGIRPKDSNFRSRGLSLFQLRLTYGAAADTVVIGAATVALSGTPIVSVYALQEVEETNDKGEFGTSPIALKKTSFQEVAFAASNANAELTLPAGNAISRVLIRTEGAVTAGEPGATVLNNLQLANGIDVRFNMSAKNCRALNNADYGYLTAGYYVADPVKCGFGGNLKLSDVWDLSGATQPKAIMDVTGGATVRAQIVTTEYILARA